MPWYASTLEAFAVTHVRPAPPERVDSRRTPPHEAGRVHDRTADTSRTDAVAAR